ncbi:tRNA (adenosine(37)-N6)-threonylcarbamoyltransferase complex ATPase subunit type 1 TsaE [Phaeobacter gallaeciensis]|uniref:tRNA threonylcarbamoyladenosine biosynthesis protein TsaE n=3 Tax=Roseobacteraceae TaxID=2854170 RepID=A0A366X0W2_9RHOB|nr:MULTISPECIES: tRNA (adenosine(37)-N6)-threonylcarbamoyltransferase complex ATPase subunit type 1 TsaE [Roseobacteraceae]MBT3142266.1 tRNA (adenosine(37)-N6)-threonylcarbamoyltransferase complex ATPase subunit type 1 TsaE [Falsiruegeria litorea]MBT8168389.1 tRNA (adenosine(37)-N6)-threonylcarbamoyltransferase complex ATPase subunit type 1 TsaE [Falsiruegeria litorea]RBW54205.1 tRNA (adenosine(37)-N6)-threonylcarbamoyltransferase complex ATPase subunit type 1 TsaE [Phaeobacter gallaeciensis]
MIAAPVSIPLDSPEMTTDLAAKLGARLTPGDCLLLVGEIGSGKTHFARSLIQTVMDHPEDVPSPTFTLVQIYDTQLGEIWHSDLYRLSDISEIEELGLSEALENAVCLIEWPDRMGPLTPANALTLAFAADLPGDDQRSLTLSWTDSKWPSLLETLL